MSVSRFRPVLFVSLGLLISALEGCGSSDSPASGSGDSSSDSKSRGLPILAIQGTAGKPATDDDDDDDPADADDDDEMDDKQEIVTPKEGTPEWLVHEATTLMLKPPPKTEDVEALKKYRRERNEKIIN